MTVRGWSASAPGATTIDLPTGTLDGDLLILFVGQYAGWPELPTSGGGTWESLGGASGSSSFTDYVALSAKVKTSGDAAVTVGLSFYPAYGGAVMAALYDVDTADLFTPVATGAGATTITAAAGTPAEGGTRLSFASQMTNFGTVPVFTTPAGTTLGAAVGGSGGYHGIAGYQDDTAAAASTEFPARLVESDVPGGNVGMSFVAYGGVEEPPPGMPSVTNVKHRSGGAWVARARKVKVGGSFVALG